MFVPLKRGAIRKIVMHPVPANWPREVSIKKSGIPHENSMSK